MQKRSAYASTEPLQFPLPFHNILVIPLNVAGFGEPSLQILRVNLGTRRVANASSLKTPLRFQCWLIERLPTPEEEAHAVFHLVVPHNWIAI